jgi:hypothetical protein
MLLFPGERWARNTGSTSSGMGSILTISNGRKSETKCVLSGPAFLLSCRDYALSGSYRNILHLPKELSWAVLRYTDPDVPLAQSDEDQLLGKEPPAPDPEGRFLALQIRLILGTAAYATMALREVTKTDTSSQFQSSLTLASEDQKFKSADGDEPMTGVETLNSET